MKAKWTVVFSLAVLLMACGNNPTTGAEGSANAASAEVTVTHREVKSEVVKTVANLSIEGMTCSAGCGGKIQKDLQALTGVIETKLDFEEERPQNVIAVEYNPETLSEQDLIRCVNSVADGRYQVRSAEVISYKGLQASQGGSAGISTQESFGKVFYVFDLLRSISQLTSTYAQ